MPIEPDARRAVVFVDGQNLFYAVKEAFGYTFPNYDIPALASAVCARRGWMLSGVRFYTGIPSAQDDPSWNHFWTAKLAVVGTRGVVSYSRSLKYRNQTVNLPDGSSTTVLVGREKGIDVRLALDVVRLAREGAYDVAVLFSQDQDLSEVADEVKQISIAQERWIQTACAPTTAPARGDSHFGVLGRRGWPRSARAGTGHLSGLPMTRGRLYSGYEDGDFYPG